jgi:hypothetical protein
MKSPEKSDDRPPWPAAGRETLHPGYADFARSRTVALVGVNGDSNGDLNGDFNGGWMVTVHEITFFFHAEWMVNDVHA